MFAKVCLAVCTALLGCAASQPAGQTAEPVAVSSLPEHRIAHHDEEEGEIEPALPGPAPLLEGVGRAEMSITTPSEQAQRYFNQGLALLHGYWYYEALRSFREVVRLDSACAMGYWGIYQTPRGGREEKREAFRKARAFAPLASEREQGYIRAMALLDSVGREAYIEEMQGLIERYPEDVEAKLFLIRFLMRGYDIDNPTAGEPDPAVLLRELLVSHPGHLAVHHYWIHVVEPGSHPERALPSARVLASLAPKAGHIVHMPGHIHYLMGEYEEARRYFLESFQVDSAYMAQYNTPPVNNWNFVHNISYLVANCAEDGRYQEGLQWARRLESVPLSGERTIIFYQGRLARPRLQIRYGFWKAAAATLAEVAANDTVQHHFARHYADGLLAYARGMAALERGEVEEAEKQAKVLKDFSWVFMVQPPDSSDRYYAQRRVDFLEVLSLDLQGQVYSARGEHAEALEKLEEARLGEEALPYEEPPEFARPVLESLGQAHARAGDWEGALAAYEKALRKRPESGHVLLGLARAYDLQGREEEARRVYEKLLQVWRQGDGDLPQLEEARQWLAAHGR